MFESRNAAILDLCRSYELVDDSILENLSASSEELERSVASLLVDQGHVSKKDLLDRVARFLSFEYRAEIPPDIPKEVVSQLSIDLARMYGVVPIESLDTVIIIAASDPFNEHLVDDLCFAVGKDVKIVVADPETIGELLEVYYRLGDVDYKGILEEIDLGNVEDEEVSLENLLNMAGETPSSGLSILSSHRRYATRPRMFISSPLKMNSKFVTGSTARCTKCLRHRENWRFP
jgi:type IV pilus assembly protein PilB